MGRNKRGSSQISNPSIILKTLRIAIIGAAKVGKTAITKQFVYKEFDPEEEELSIDEVYNKQVVINGETLILEILDAGQGLNNPLVEQHFTGFDGYLLVFSLWDMDSLNAVINLRSRIRVARRNIDSYETDFDIPMILVGNKKDLIDDGRISDEVLECAKTFSMPLVTTSAWTGEGIYEAFEAIINEINVKSNYSFSTDDSRVKKSRTNKCIII